jgi:anti-anti-sigma factor
VSRQIATRPRTPRRAWVPPRSVDTPPAATTTRFSCATQQAGERARLLLRGELDHDTVPEVHAAVDAALAAGTKILVVDLSELDGMDASGLELTRDIARAASGRGLVCAFVPGPAVVQEQFAASGLDARLAFVHSLPGYSYDA